MAGVLAVAFGLRIWGVKQGLPYVYNVDEAANFVPGAVGYFFTDSYNPHYFVNPPAYSYLLHAVFAFWFGGGWPFGAKYDVGNAYATDPTQVFVVARVTAAVLGTAAVGFIYLTGKRLYDRRVGLIAAALMAVAFLPVFYSHLALNDVPALLPLSVSLYGAAGVLKRGKTIDYLLAGRRAGAGGRDQVHGRHRAAGAAGGDRLPADGRSRRRGPRRQAQPGGGRRRAARLRGRESARAALVSRVPAGAAHAAATSRTSASSASTTTPASSTTSGR